MKYAAVDMDASLVSRENGQRSEGKEAPNSRPMILCKLDTKAAYNTT